MVDISAEQYFYALEQIHGAKRRLSRLETSIGKNSESKFIDRRARQSEIIIDCQICIETSTKAIFALLNIQYQQKHDLGLSDATNLLNKIFNSKEFEFKRKNDIPRALFLTQFWAQFYTLAKYGYQQHWITPYDLFRSGDGEYAVKHATFCVELADDLASYQAERYREKYGEHPEDVHYVSRHNLNSSADVDKYVESSEE